jgi:hypothetical protein
VAGAESGTVRRQHHRADGLVGGDVGPGQRQRLEQRFRQAVARRRAVEDDNGDVAVALALEDRRGRVEVAGALDVHAGELNPMPAPRKRGRRRQKTG